MNEPLCFICGVNQSYKDGMCKKCKGVFGSLENVPVIMEQFYKDVDLIKQSGEGFSSKPQTLDELCHREIVKIRELTLKDDIYTSHLLGDAVGSPIGITACVQARMNQIADLQADNERLLKSYRGVIKENLQLKSERDQLDELYTETFEMNKAQRIERDNAIKERNKLIEDNKALRLALAEISEDGMNKPFPLDGFGAVSDAITQAKYDAGEIARAALLKTKV